MHVNMLCYLNKSLDTNSLNTFYGLITNYIGNLL